MEFSYSLELTRLVFVAGLFYAVFYKRFTHVTPGGIISGALLAIALDQSVAWFFTLLFLSAIVAISYRLIFKSKALTTREQTFTHVMLSVLFVAIAHMLMFQNENFELFLPGYVVPGLIALMYNKYKVKDVLIGLNFCVIATYATGVALAKLIPYHFTTELSTIQSGYDTSFNMSVLPILLVISSLISYAIYKVTNARSGGIIIATFIAFMLIWSPIQAALFFAATAITYGIIQLLLRYTAIIGVERFAATALVAVATTTALESIAYHLNIDSSFARSVLLLPIIVSIWVNELNLTRDHVKLALNTGMVLATNCLFLLIWKWQ